jgi:hypothetical protein
MPRLRGEGGYLVQRDEAMKRHRITLEFKSAFDKRYFLGQLSDGWGENRVRLEWPKGKNLCACRVNDVIHVDPSLDKEFYEHARGMKERLKKMREDK